ncbi:MAG: hypothetical protein ACOZNI_17375 [Myxococcota bacterium]
MFLSLLACTAVIPDTATPLSLTITSPTYGAFAGDGPVRIEGVVSPANAEVMVDGVIVRTNAFGEFTAEATFAEGRRALLVDVFALRGEEKVRQIVPVFDGVDPREADPGAITGLLTPTGLDAMEPLVAAQIDALGWEDQILAALPALETDYVSITPTAVSSDGAAVDLFPGADDVGLTVTLQQVTLSADIDVLGWVIPMDAALDVTIGAHAVPDLADDMLTLALTDAEVALGETALSFGGLEVPDWLMELIADPIAELVGQLGDALGDLLLDQVGAIEVGGPFAFETDLLGTTLSARLVDVGASLDGVGLGATVTTGEPAGDTLPEMPALAALTPSGLPYQLGAAVHEGLINTIVDATLADFLQIDLELEGSMGELIGGGIRALPGGEDVPEGTEGWCMSLDVGDARVVRMVEGTGTPFAQAWLPDVQLEIGTVLDGDCEDWLEAQLFAVVDLTLEGTELSADFQVVDVKVLDYGADTTWNDAGDELGDVVEGLAGLAVGQLSFDLADMGFGEVLPGIELSPRVVSVEPLDETGLYGVYLDVF